MSEKVRPRPPGMTKAILYMVLLLLYLPLLVMITGSFIKDGNFSFDWYQAVISDQTLIESLGRSLYLGAVASVGATGLGLLAALAIYKTDFPFKQYLNIFSVVSIVIPELVFALALLSWFVIVGLQLSLWTVVIAHITFCLAFSLFLIGSRLAQLDSALDDAARDLGASPWVCLQKVTIPLVLPAILASVVLCFLLSFDDFLISYFVNGVGSDTLPIKLYTAMKQGHSPKLNALSTLMIAMTIALLASLLSSRSIRRIS
jgi:spermidine/putrescine transport system permease protein